MSTVSVRIREAEVMVSPNDFSQDNNQNIIRHNEIDHTIINNDAAFVNVFDK